MEPDGIRNASTAKVLMITVSPAATGSRKANSRQSGLRRALASGLAAGAGPA
jgi:hypothetical protein